MIGSYVPAATVAAHDAIAETLDQDFTYSVTGKAQRDSVWRELDRCFHPGQRVVELECSTGFDTVYLAGRGIEVWACDSSVRMLEAARRRISSSKLPAPVRLLPAAEEVSKLQDQGPFDGAFSNFGRLNCIEDMAGVGRCLASLLRPGARAVLCMAGTCVAWEIIWFLHHGRYRQAFRRFQRGPVYVRLVDDMRVACWYPSVRSLQRAFRPCFRLLHWTGVGVVVPPSYLEGQAKRFPRVMNVLTKMDPWLGRIPLVRGLADHLLLTFERVDS